MKRYVRNGFTLVELIVVIAIIAILTAIAVPRVESFVNDARETKRINDFKAVYTAAHTGTVSWMINEGNKLGLQRHMFGNSNVLSSECYTTGSGNETLQTFIEDRLPTGAILKEYTNSYMFFLFIDTDPNIIKDHIMFSSFTDDSNSDTWEVYTYGAVGKDGLKGVLIYNDGYISVNGSNPVEMVVDEQYASGFWIYNITDGKFDIQSNVIGS